MTKKGHLKTSLHNCFSPFAVFSADRTHRSCNPRTGSLQRRPPQNWNIRNISSYTDFSCSYSPWTRFPCWQLIFLFGPSTWPWPLPQRGPRSWSSRSKHIQQCTSCRKKSTHSTSWDTSFSCMYILPFSSWLQRRSWWFHSWRFTVSSQARVLNRMDLPGCFACSGPGWQWSWGDRIWRFRWRAAFALD